MWAHVNEPVPELSALRPDLPRALTTALATAIAKDPGHRRLSAGAFAHEAYAALAE